MGKDSAIAWTHHTFNPWTRCEKVSPACDHCYAETWAGRATHPKDSEGRSLPLWGRDAPRTTTSAHNWRQPRRWNEEAAQAGRRARVFCASLADVFEDHPSITARPALWKLIEDTPSLDWLLLTKRPENMTRFAPDAWRNGWPDNVWAGTTVESQRYAEERIPHLLKVPARVRFLSVEPMLEEIDLTDLVRRDGPGEHHYSALECDVDAADDGDWNGAIVSWVICGGESGSKGRGMDLWWARDLRDQCLATRTPFFMKQIGKRPFMSYRADRALGAVGLRVAGGTADGGLALHVSDDAGTNTNEWPEDLRACRAFPEVRP